MAVAGKSILSARHCKAIFVSGFRKPAVLAFKNLNKSKQPVHEVKQTSWRLESLIHGYPERQRNEKQERETETRNRTKPLHVVNESKCLNGVSERSVAELHEMLYEMPEDEGAITRVLVCHSHGAKLVHEALKDDVFFKFLRSKNEKNAKFRAKQITDHLAVISLGGIQVLPNNFAKICWNFRFSNDRLASWGRSMFGKSCDEAYKEIVFGTDLTDTTVLPWTIKHRVQHYIESNEVMTEFMRVLKAPMDK